MRKITEANSTKDPSHVDAILPSLRDLRGGWAEMEVPDDDARAQTVNRRVAPTDVHHRMSITG